MNSWSLDSLRQRVGRKIVPEGSNDFQRVRDQILCCDDREKPCNTNSDVNQAKEIIVSHRRNDQQEEDITDSTFNLDEAYMICDYSLTETNRSDNNNNLREGVSDIKCASRQCHEYHQTYEDDYTTCPTNITDTDYFEDSLSTSQTEHTTTPICTIQDSGQVFTMGASCSSNIYDNREWHNVKGDGSDHSAKPKKRGRLLKRLVSNERPAENSKVPSDTCNCQHHESNNYDAEPASRPVNFHTNGLENAFDKRTSLSPEDISVTCGRQLTSNRLSPNVDSSGHVQLTRVVGSGRARATASCDVSPHRLLTRRNNSPNNRSSGVDAKSVNSSSYEERQRSHSWSNGKLGTKTNFKTSSLTVRSSNPVRNMKVNSPQTVSERVSKTPPAPVSAAPKPQNKLSKTETHAPECPLHQKHEDVPKISVSKSQGQEEFDPDLAPMQRRRAASESQTMRPRRLLPRTPDSCDQIQEHVHVRWADEEHGSSLSTSVFLSSIRPRSYSYGAMDNAPHRPILKKVGGF